MLVLQLPQILYLIVNNNYLISNLLVSYQSMVLLVQFRVKVQRHWIGLRGGGGGLAKIRCCENVL